jgi:dienelactone hydrolase
MKLYRISLAAAVVLVSIVLPAATFAAVPLTPGDRMFNEYFRVETAQVGGACLTNIATRADWEGRRAQYRQELAGMLGLWPHPPRTDLKAVVTGTVEQEEFRVENLHFQSLPGLYVTANLYVPKGLASPAPAILYVCGHGPVISNGVSYGNKVAYQHHGAWFARQGYVCLVVDTLQLGEIQGLHHGTYREKMWWWNARGYTPAGVEAWNSIRALDFLETRPEVDKSRFGVTGRSGGGAYSWWVAALDERIKAAAPVAGITDLQNHVVDGTVEGHCDCMFLVNTYRWDYPQVAALVAPRPLLVVNTDSDTIFPLDGVYRTFVKVRPIYELCGARDKLGLVIGPGPHKDTQNLQVPVLRWFNRHLKGADPVIEKAAAPFFTPAQLKVFRELPADAVNTNIHETFVAAAKPGAAPASLAEWEPQRQAWLEGLRTQTFAGWPKESGPLAVERRWSAVKNDIRFEAFDFTSQPAVRLRLYVARAESLDKPERMVLRVLGSAGRPDYPGFHQWLAGWRGLFGEQLAEELALESKVAGSGEDQSAASPEREVLANRTVYAWMAPRGIGLTATSGDERRQTQLRRRFMLLGQTLDGMRVWDIRRALAAAREIKLGGAAPLELHGAGAMGVDALYASVFEKPVAGLELWDLPASHRQGPDLLNVLRVLDLPQTVALAAEHSQVKLRQAEAGGWDFPIKTSRNLGWGEGRVEVLPATQEVKAQAAESAPYPGPGFVALFNGKDLAGWKGLLASPNDNPIKRAKLTPEQLAAAQKEADQNMQAHWKVEDRVLVFDGKGRNLCTAKDYGDFELLVDWKIPPRGDSGIYLRGSPQVQIWDNRVGSGGLYNNQKHPSTPLKVADRPPGQWNRFRILMRGEKVTVYLNDELVVESVTMENYWDRSQPIFPTGTIELQSHGDKLWFKNIYVRELPQGD